MDNKKLEKKIEIDEIILKLKFLKTAQDNINFKELIDTVLPDNQEESTGEIKCNTCKKTLKLPTWELDTMSSIQYHRYECEECYVSRIEKQEEIEQAEIFEDEELPF